MHADVENDFISTIRSVDLDILSVAIIITMGKTKISWAEMVWNPFVGCTRVSTGCEKCYAERFTARFSSIPGHKFEGVSRNTPNGPRWSGKVILAEKDIDQPLRWKKPRRIFVNSISDTFHDTVPIEWLDRIFAIMTKAPQHIFLVLTKRPHYMRDYMRSRYHFPNTAPQIGPPRNIWLGTSVENQAARNIRQPLLQQTPAALRFLSVEPLLEEINLGNLDGISWVIVGGESGPGARPCDIGWIRSIRDQCKSVGVACFVKQLGARPMVPGTTLRFNCFDRKGGDPAEWPNDLKVRETP